MAKYVCDICNWEYDEAAGLPDQGIAPGTKWEELPEDFKVSSVRCTEGNVHTAVNRMG